MQLGKAVTPVPSAMPETKYRAREMMSAEGMCCTIFSPRCAGLEGTTETSLRVASLVLPNARAIDSAQCEEHVTFFRE